MYDKFCECQEPAHDIDPVVSGNAPTYDRKFRVRCSHVATLLFAPNILLRFVDLIIFWGLYKK